MEARANAVGAGGQLHYMFPSYGGLNAKDAAAGAIHALYLCAKLI